MKEYTFDKTAASTGTAAEAAGAAGSTASAAGSKVRRSYLTGAMRAPKEAVASIKKGFRRLSIEGRDAIMVWKDDKGKATIRRKDLTFHKELGLGMSGTVYLGKVANTNTTCCVKLMQKMKLIRLDQVDNIMRERELMQSFDTPFVMQSHCAFQDSGFLYLVMEYMAGGDLFQLLVNGTEKGLLAPAAARFYAAEVLMALEFLHNKHHIYRDLKPENILIAANGHIKLADLGFCKPLMPGDRTYTTCGTSDYMAPEVMLSQGYGKSADYWAFGVFIYEMLTGYAPFMGKSDSDRHRRILTADLRFRADFHLQAKDLVQKLCVVDLSHRYGMMARAIEDIKDHPFFSAEYDWNQLANREIAPPIYPKVRKAEDMLRETLKSVAKATELDALSPHDDALFALY
jgi:serine/threonine protein kinase